MPDSDSTDPSADFATRLREKRREAGLSQGDLAGVELSASYVSLLESGRRNPTRETLTILAERLGCTVEYLSDGQDPEQADRLRLALSYADLALRNSEPGDALTQLDALTAANPQLDADDLLQVRRLRARALEGIGELEQALREIEDLREQAHQARRYDEHLRLTVDAVRCYQEVGDVTYALDVGETALASIRSWGLLGTDTHAKLASTVLGAYYLRGDLVRAQQMATEVLDSLGDQGSPAARAAVYWNASLVAEQRDDLPAALMLAERALAVYAEGDDVRALARLRVAYGWLLLRSMPARPEDAHRELTASRGPLVEAGSEVDVAYCDTELSRCELLLGRPGYALSLADSALARLGPEPRLERAHTTLVRARALLALDRRDDAVATYREAASTLSGLDLSRHAASAWRELADAFAELGLLEDATLAYQQALTDAGVRAAPDVRYARQEISLESRHDSPGSSSSYSDG
jgi:tetratricopeptide (TPR) repeat protein